MTRTPAPEWQYRNADGRIIRKADAFPDLAPQEPMPDPSRIYGALCVLLLVALGVVCAVSAMIGIAAHLWWL